MRKFFIVFMLLLFSIGVFVGCNNDKGSSNSGNGGVDLVNPVTNETWKPSSALKKSGKLQIGTDADGVETSALDIIEKKIVYDVRSSETEKGSLNCVVASITDVELEEGFYKYSINVVSSNTSLDQILLELRVIDTSTGKAIDLASFLCTEFDGEENVATLSFHNTKDGKYDLQVFTYNLAGFTINEFSIKKVEKNEIIKQDISAYMKGDVENSIEYDENAIYYFDVRKYIEPIEDTRVGYDMISVLTTLQGLVNRNGVHMYVNFSEYGFPNTLQSVDNFWLEDLMAEGNFLHGRTVIVIQKPATLLRLFKNFYNGLAVWDEDVPATSNVASTVCGVEDLLPVRFDDRNGSLYNILTEEYNMPVKLDLNDKFTGEGTIPDTNIASTKSKKNDAYRWAIEKYLKTGKCSLEDVAYYTDAFSWDNSGSAYVYNFYKPFTGSYMFTYLGNRDYIIAKKGFFFDLFPYPEESFQVPNDDITQEYGTDYETLELILSTISELNGKKQIYIHGYNNLFIKYSQHVANVSSDYLPSSSAVADEGILSSMISRYYGMVIANAVSYTTIANQSVYCQTPAIDYTEYVNPIPADYNTRAIENKTYLTFYMGDYDGITWPYAFWHKFASDDKFGEIPLMWAVSPACERIAPNIYQYLYKQGYGKQIYYGCSNNGAGFTQVQTLKAQSNGKGGTLLDNYKELTVTECERMGIDLMGFLINDWDYNGAEEEFLNVKGSNGSRLFKYAYGAWGYTFRKVGDVAAIGAGGYYATASGNDIANQIKNGYGLTKNNNSPQFVAIRTILCDPTSIYGAIETLKSQGYNVEVLDPYTFGSMVERTMFA